MKTSPAKNLIYYFILFAILILGINFIFGLFLNIRILFQESTYEDERGSLPVYKNNEIGRIIFKEFNSLKTDYVSYVGWKRREYSGKTIHINSDGYRYDPNQVLVNNNDAKNVYFFGGSTMWGTGVEDNSTIPAIWSQINSNGGYNVYNYGESGYDSRQSLESLINTFSLNKKIDIAVFYVGVNEINRCRNIIRTNSHALEKQYRDKINEKSSYFETIFYLNTKTVVEKAINKLIKKTDSSYDLMCECENKRVEKVIDDMYINLKLAKFLIEKNGGKFIVVLQPVLFVEKPKKDYLNNYLKKVENGLEQNYQKLYLGYKNHKDFLLLNDFTSAFNLNRNIFIDECHVNETGNNIIAHKIDSLIKYKVYN